MSKERYITLMGGVQNGGAMRNRRICENELFGISEQVNK